MDRVGLPHYWDWIPPSDDPVEAEFFGPDRTRKLDRAWAVQYQLKEAICFQVFWEKR